MQKLMVFDSQGNSLEAIQNHEKAIQLQPDYADAYNNVGIILSRLGRPEEAVDIYDKAIDLEPDYFEAYNNRGSLLEDLQRHEEARKSYTNSIRLKSDYALAYSNRGRVQKKIGNYEGIMEDFSKTIELGSWGDNASDQNLKSRLYVNLGDILMIFRNYAKALAAYNEALNIEPDNQNLIGMKGNAIAALGDIEEVLKLKQQGYGVVSFDSLKGVSINYGRS